MASFTYAGPGVLYEEDYPDELAAVGSGEPLLEYAGGGFAGVGMAHKSALVGFPLELVDGDADRAAVLTALLGFVH